MAIRLMAAAFFLDLPPTDKLVLLALADSANDEGACFPSLRYLMAKTSLCERALRNAYTRLESRGLLRREFRQGRSTVYWVDEAAFLAAQGVRKAPLTPARGAPPTPASGAGTPASGAGTPASGAGTPASGAPISVSYPSLSRKLTSEARNAPKPTLKSVPRKPEAPPAPEGLANGNSPEGEFSAARRLEQGLTLRALLEGAVKPFPKKG